MYQKYWNEVFSNVSEYDVTSAIEVPEIEAAINWITDGNLSLIHILSKNNCNRKYRHNRSTDSVDIFSRNRLMIIGE